MHKSVDRIGGDNMDANSSNDLKNYLMKDFRDQKHKYDSLIDIFRKDHSCFLQMKKNHQIREDAEQFFSTCEKQLMEAESISVDAFRKLKYEQIIGDYIVESEKKKVNKSPLKKKRDVQPPDSQITQKYNTFLHLKEFPQILCPHDLEILTCKNVRWVRPKKQRGNSRFEMPLYRCDLCGKGYTVLYNYNDMETIELEGYSYLNLGSKGTKRTASGTKIYYLPYLTRKRCMVYGIKKPVKCARCEYPLKKVKFRMKSKRGKESTTVVEWCYSCGMIYVHLDIYEQFKDCLDCKNKDSIETLRKETKLKADMKKRTKEEMQKKKTDSNGTSKDQIKLEQAIVRKIEKQFDVERDEKIPTKKTLDKIYEHDNTIRVRDFVVRRSVFKCMHNDHKLQNINAVISIINKDGNIIQTNVSAGYCPNCNTFFILESIYERLKIRGTPVCRVSDEKTYLKGNNYIGGMKLAQESILMQYGYSVSQQEGLTTARRHKILAVMLDNEILTKSEIISYLDFFITQRQYQHRFEVAISRWENDREFVADYNKDSYARYGVKGIYRNI